MRPVTGCSIEPMGWGVRAAAAGNMVCRPTGRWNASSIQMKMKVLLGAVRTART